MIHDKARELLDIINEREVIKTYQEGAAMAYYSARELVKEGALDQATVWQRMAREYALETQWRLTALLYPEE